MIKIFKLKWHMLAAISLLLLTGCEDDLTKSLEVMATAYNSTPSQTDTANPNQAAWGDFLEPGMKAIAVSRDLIPLGLGYKTEVEIEGLSGTFIVLDKMHKRKKKTIDIYMGNDLKAAKEWGRKKVTIKWRVPRNSNSSN
jgi:3D (Asp-Asp-Asp) domain-containing protein